MAGTAVLMPHGDKSETLTRLLASALGSEERLELMIRMVVGGLEVLADDLLAWTLTTPQRGGDKILAPW